MKIEQPRSTFHELAAQADLHRAAAGAVAADALDVGELAAYREGLDEGVRIETVSLDDAQVSSTDPFPQPLVSSRMKTVLW